MHASPDSRPGTLGGRIVKALLLGGQALELAIHREMVGYRVNGEWFDDKDGMDWFIERMEKLGSDMLRVYRTEKRIPDFREFAPYDELDRRETDEWHRARQRSRARALRGPRLSG